MSKLTDTKVRALREPGRYGDGGALYLHVRPGGSRQWVLRAVIAGTRKDIGLGPYPVVTLAEARKRALEMRRQIEAGINPLAARQRERKMPTFAAGARARHAELVPGFRNAKHAAQWITSLETYAFPTLGEVRIDEITPAMVRDALLPIWLAKPETARRVLQRIADVLVWAVAKSFRESVPMLSAKALRLPRQRRTPAHHAAMPFDEVPDFIARLRELEGISRLALEALILTAARSGEIRGATWGEVDLEARLWTVPAERMKAGRPHVVPLSAAAVDAFQRAARFRRPPGSGGPDLVFPGLVKGKPLSDMALTKLLRDLETGVTAHGFRSSFRDWAAERTAFPAEVAEMALAHAIADKTEAAYRRGNLLEKRRALMEAWGEFCTGAIR